MQIKKCPNCKNINFNSIDEEFIKKTTITNCYEKYQSHKYPQEYRIKPETDCYEEKVCVFNITYKCDDCKHIWNKKVYKDDSKC